jgi:hypothetical protein
MLRGHEILGQGGEVEISVGCFPERGEEVVKQ